MRFIQEFMDKSIPAQDDEIEPFHKSLKTDYIGAMEIKDFSKGEKIIENVFSDYKGMGRIHPLNSLHSIYSGKDTRTILKSVQHTMKGLKVEEIRNRREIG